METVALEKKSNAELANGTESYDIKTLLSDLKVADKWTNDIPLTGEYFEPEEGEIHILAYIGRTSFMGINNEPVEAIRLLDKKGKALISASAIIASATKGLPVPSILKIVKTGEKKAAVGMLHIFQVSELRK